ncbi:MAG: hypothetical protein ACREOE_13320, partial [Gemmatimonadales bacterium]
MRRIVLTTALAEIAAGQRGFITRAQRRWRVADDLPVQEPADAAALILEHGEGDPAHVGQLMQEAIAVGLTDPRHAAQALAPVARR